MNKTLVIIGSVAVLGVGAFLYFKNKNTSDIRVVGAGNKNVGSGTETVLKDNLGSSIKRAGVGGGRRNNNA
jgi:hypothetical protein